MARRPALRLPAQPLLDRITRNGGLATVMACAGIEPEDPTTTDGMSAAYRRYHRRLLRGEEQGWFTFGMADDLAIELLKVHPLFVWGDDLYFNPIDPNVVEEADDTEPVLAHAA